MWLTGFDVECLSTLYLDKPMKTHTLMQAIARANRVYPNKDFGLLVDYNGMLKNLRAAYAQYATGDGAGGDDEIVSPIEERVADLIEALDETEAHLIHSGFDPATLLGASGFPKIRGLRDAVNVLYQTDDTKRRFEILARAVFSRFKALVTEPTAHQFNERHDNIEAIYKKLQERRDMSDVTEVMKGLHRIINKAIATDDEGDDQKEAASYDLSQIDLEKLRDEFEKRVKRKPAAIQDIRQLVEEKLALMLAANPARMDYYRKYTEIVADYNREKDRVTMEQTFADLWKLAQEMDEESERAAREGLSEAELAIFDILKKDKISKADRERVKRTSRHLLERLRELVLPLDQWTEKESTRAMVETAVLDQVYELLPSPPFSPSDKDALAESVFRHLWEQTDSRNFPQEAA